MAKLNIGADAPDFSIEDQDGNLVKLNDYSGSKLVLYFYPRADTPGCTAESCNLRDNYEALIGKGFKILGVSADKPDKQQKFKEKYDLPFSLIPDVDKEVINKYGAWGKKKLYGGEYEGIKRMTFVISEDGKIEQIFEKVQTKDHAGQILEKYNNNNQ